MTERVKSLLERTFEKEQKKFRRDVDWKPLLALVVCAAVGWFVAGGLGNVRARCPQRAVDGGLGQTALPVAGNGQDARCPSAGPAAKPRRKAPIRSSSDVEVQRRILKANIAALEKRLAAAKKEAERIAAARAAQGSNGALDEVALLKQRSEALKKLGKKLEETTVGELREHAPDWWARELQGKMRWCDGHRKLTVHMEKVLSSVDEESMTEAARELHLRLMERLAETSSFYDGLIDAIKDETPYAEFEKIEHTVFEEVKKDHELAQKERKVLHDMMSRMFNLSGEDVAALDAVCKKTEKTVQNGGTGWTFKDPEAKSGAKNGEKGAAK